MYLLKKSIHISSIIFISVIIGTLIFKTLNSTLGTQLNNFIIYDSNFSFSSNKIAIIKIDDKSLDKLQKSDLKIFNIQKKIFSKAIEILENAGAKVIGIDIVFKNEGEDVNELKNTIEKYNNVIIAAKIGNKNDSEYSQALPLDIFDKKYWGAIDVEFFGNIINRYKPFHYYSKDIIEAFSIKIFKKYIGDKDLFKGKIENNKYIVNPIKKIPLNNDKTILIKFFNDIGGYDYYSFIDLLEGKIPKEKIKDKIILIGESGTLIHDAHFSPISQNKQMNGVEFHANILDSLIQNQYLQELSLIYKYLLILLALLLLSISFFFLDLKKNILIILIFILSVIFPSRILLHEGIFVNVFEILVYGITTFIIAYLYRFFIVDKNKRYIEGAFSHYLSKDIVAKIAEDANSLKLGGEKKKITVFFSDIVGFTSMSETLGTDKIFNLLGEYLSEMTEILIKNKGTLDKYIGDAVMGFYNAPFSIDNPEYMACVTALEQQKKLIELNEKWKKTGEYPPLNARIGINSGEAMVGNIGSKNRFNYTVIGDHVNLASRLEGVNKEYLTKICVSEDTYNAVKNDFIFRELDTIKVKGKTKGIKIYELVGYKNDNIEIQKIKEYEKGLYLYYNSEYKKAKKIFEENIGDLPSTKMILRCDDVINGKIKVIDGIFELTSK